MKILLIEDHVAVAQITCSLLREVHEHEVEHAATAAEALAKLGPFQPEVVLVDLNLPDMDGYELARRIRARPEGAALSLVALTGWGCVVDAKALAEAGFDAHYRKPMDFDLLRHLPLRRGAPLEGSS